MQHSSNNKHIENKYTGNKYTDNINTSELTPLLQTELNQNGFIELNNHGEGFFSKGWIFSNNTIFDHQQLISLIRKLKVVRAKGIVVTEKGSYSFNKVGSEFNFNKASKSVNNRIELIDTKVSILNDVTCEQLLMLKRN